MPKSNTKTGAAGVSSDHRDRISFYVDAMKDPKNREALALEMVYLRAQDDARKAEQVAPHTLAATPDVDDKRLNELLIQVGPTEGLRHDSRDLSLTKLWQFARLAIAEACGNAPGKAAAN